MPNDLKLNTVTVTAQRDPNSPGTHSGWLGIFGKADTTNVDVSFETVNLGKNTALQLHGELQQEVVVGTVNITGDVPENSNASEYDTENNAAQIETWGASWGQHNGNTGSFASAHSTSKPVNPSHFLAVLQQAMTSVRNTMPAPPLQSAPS